MKRYSRNFVEGSVSVSKSEGFGEKALSIFVTDADKTSMDIQRMSDFMGNRINHLVSSLISKGDSTPVPIKKEDISTIDEMLRSGKSMQHPGFDYVLDPDSLPKEVLDRYRRGEWGIAESRQTPGNYRAWIADARNNQKKEITLKKVERTQGNSDLMQSMAIQAQLRQINERLDTIIELQGYHIDFNRNSTLVAPFFNARDHVVHAQNEDDPEKRREYLDKAVEQLESAINNIFLDINTLTKRFLKLTRFPVFRPTKTIDKYTGYIAQDLQLLAKYNGVHMQILDYMNKVEDKKAAYKKYRDFMLDFYTKAVGSKQLPLSLQIHNACGTYTAENLDAWKIMTDEMVPVLQNQSNIESAYIISLEGDGDVE